MKNSNDTIGNRTRDLPACSALPQPTALPRAPTQNKNIAYYSLRLVTFSFMRSALFWVITKQVVEIPYRRFGTTYRSHIQGSRIQKKKETLVRNYHYSLRNDPEASNHAFSYTFEVLASEIH